VGFASTAHAAAGHFANGGVVFQRGDSIFLAGPNGSAPIRLTSNNVDADPVFSPDGSKIAFDRSQPSGRSDIFVMNPDGSGVIALTATSGVGEGHPTWSPDGSQIAYTRCGNCNLWVMTSSGANQHPISRAVDGFDAAWSPDGKLIAFDSETRGVGCAERILVMRPDGTHIRALTPCGPGSAFPTWSPDGTRLAFSRTGSFGSRIFIMNRDGSREHRISPRINASQPSWSPDGAQILFSWNRGISHLAVMMRPNGRDRTTILSRAGQLGWQPTACTITGTNGADHLVGTTGNDVICGLGGEDLIAGSGGTDIISGGASAHDAVSFLWAPAGIHARIALHAAAQGTEYLSGIEDAYGSPFADEIRGDALANIIRGGSGADTIHGGAADDVIRGGPGRDSIRGGIGADHLYGGPDHDTLDGRDSKPDDTLDGGSGSDTCLFDQGDLVRRC
jgi:Tol biopolymer transport system component